MRLLSERRLRSVQDSLTAGRPFRLPLRAYIRRLSLTHNAFTLDEITLRVSSSASVSTAPTAPTVPTVPTVPTRSGGGLCVGEVVGVDVGVDVGVNVGADVGEVVGAGPQNDGSRAPPVQTTDLIHSNWLPTVV